jgi:hypothetical protein
MTQNNDEVITNDEIIQQVLALVRNGGGTINSPFRFKYADMLSLKDSWGRVHSGRTDGVFGLHSEGCRIYNTYVKWEKDAPKGDLHIPCNPFGCEYVGVGSLKYLGAID